MTKSMLDFNKERSEEILKSLKEDSEQIKDMLDEIKFMGEAINGQDKTWQGKSQESFYDSFKTISGKFDEIGNNLDRHNGMLGNTIESYDLTEKHVESNANEKAEDLDVN